MPIRRIGLLAYKILKGRDGLFGFAKRKIDIANVGRGSGVVRIHGQRMFKFTDGVFFTVSLQKIGSTQDGVLCHLGAILHSILPEGRKRISVSFKELNRSEEHTSELQSQSNLVCRLLLEKKN